jgi:hypothetical protein
MDFQESRKKERQRPFLIATNELFAMPAEKEEEKEKKEHNTTVVAVRLHPCMLIFVGCHHLKTYLSHSILMILLHLILVGKYIQQNVQQLLKMLIQNPYYL